MNRSTCVFLATVATLLALTAQPAHASLMFVANLDGSQEVGPVVTTTTGQARFHLSVDQTMLDFELDVFAGVNITAAHIHLAPAGVNGGVVAFLFGTGPVPLVNGSLATGTLLAGHLINALAGQSIAALVQEFENGNAYVNVHSQANPGGEIRGQIAQVVSEPATACLLAIGLLGAGYARRRHIH